MSIFGKIFFVKRKIGNLKSFFFEVYLMHTITAQLTEDAKMIREEVFVIEQGFAEEFDKTDSQSKHIVLYIHNRPAATCRYYFDESKDCYIIGRVAVLPAFRGTGLGKKVMELAEKSIAENGGKNIQLSAQTRVQGFYEKCGYTAKGEAYLDQDCPHICMEKTL